MQGASLVHARSRLRRLTKAWTVPERRRNNCLAGTARFWFWLMHQLSQAAIRAIS